MRKLKNFSRAIIAIAMMLITAFDSLAHDFEVDGIYYYIDSSTDKTVGVTYCGNSYSEVANEYSGSVTIPSTVTYSGVTYSVTTISSGSNTTFFNGAFSGCTGLTSVTIPSSVTSIGNYAFYGCTGLTSVTIPNSVISIGNYAFYGCTGLTSVTIPNSVISIGNSAFCYCSSLASVTIGNSVTKIGGGAFHETPWYHNQPDGMVYINNILYSYKGVMPIGTSIDINEGTISISSGAFANCTGLTSVTIPNSVTYIGGHAFYYCSDLTTINYNAVNCTTMGHFDELVFFGCTALTTVNFGDNVINIPPYAFYECNGLTAITIPNSVTYIGGSAFYGCSNLTGGLTIPNSVTYIGGYAFYGCTGFTSLTIGNSVSTIYDHAFSCCNGLTKVIIPNSVTAIGDGVFGGCSGLTSIVVEDGNSTYDSRENCNAIIETSTNTLIKGCDNSIIPKSVTSIDDYAFANCTGLTSVTIPNSVKEIAPSSFSNCPNLCIDIEQGTDSIGIYSSNLFTCKKISIGRPLKYKNTDYATRYNLFNSISELVIDYEIEELTDYMFKGCKNLKVLSVGKGDSELKIGYLESGNYYNERGKGLFYNLPLDSVYIGRPISYDAAKCYGYSPFADVKTLRHLTLNCNNINTTLMPYFFENCNSLETVIIQNSHSQMSLPAEFFKGCVNLKSLILPFPGTGTAQTTSNFGELFGTESNSNMRAVTQYFEDGTNKTYYLPTGLEELVLTEGCEMIPYGGLYNCNMLKKLTLPTSLYMVGDKALYGCAQIAGIYCKGADPAVAYDSSFDGMRLTSCKLHVPYNSSERYKISDGWKRFYYVEEEAPLVVSIAKNIENAGVVYGINEYQPGQVAEVEAVAHSGYTFVGWYENGNLLTTDSKYTVMVTESHSLVAMFAPVLDENDVEVSPKAENVTLTWTQETGAEYYNIDIYSNAAMTMPVGSMVVDNSGQPVSRSATAVSATIDGLSELQNYYYSITAYGAEDTILSKYTGSFSTIAGVEGVMGDTNAVEVARYDIHGRLLSTPAKGINIVKYSDGTVKKIIHN